MVHHIVLYNMKQRDFVHSRRKIRRFDSADCAVVQPRQTLRDIVDCMLTKKPFNNQLRSHQPLEPDGENMDDWEIGTREINDLADLSKLNSEVEEAQLSASTKQDEERKEREKKAFDDAVNAEIAKRQSASSDL